MTWRVTLRDGNYMYVCDVHPSSMRGRSRRARRRRPTRRLRLVADRHRQDEASPHIGARVHDHAEDRGRKSVKSMKTGTYTVVVRDRGRTHNAHVVAPGLQPPDDTAHLYGHADLEGEARPHRHVPVPLRPACRERHEGFARRSSLAWSRPRRPERSRRAARQTGPCVTAFSVSDSPWSTTSEPVSPSASMRSRQRRAICGETP